MVAILSRPKCVKSIFQIPNSDKVLVFADIFIIKYFCDKFYYLNVVIISSLLLLVYAKMVLQDDMITVSESKYRSFICSSWPGDAI